MKTIWKLFVGDIRRITSNVVSIIIVIGLGLSATAINMAFTGGGEAFNGVGLAAAAITLLAAVFFSTFFSGLKYST